uniref:proteoglycan 4-like n=1 Tax=Gasterosteus aculeatus aculeatus TaxID=481459 RepID=UPI001A980A65|nr:proteoglycan 4-like [Gasterosteus aculeatus aculeatus]
MMQGSQNRVTHNGLKKQQNWTTLLENWTTLLENWTTLLENWTPTFLKPPAIFQLNPEQKPAEDDEESTELEKYAQPSHTRQEVKVEAFKFPPDLKDIIRKHILNAIDECFEAVRPLAPVSERTCRNFKSPGCISQVLENDKEPHQQPPSSSSFLVEKEVGVTRPKTPLQVRTDRKRPPSSTQRLFLVEEEVKVTQPETPLQVETDKKRPLPSTQRLCWMEKEVGVTRPKKPIQVKTDKKRPPSSTERLFLVEEVKVTRPKTPLQVETDKKRPPPSTERLCWMEKEVGVTRPKKPIQVKTDKKRPPSSTERLFLVEEVTVTRLETPVQVKTDKKPSILKRFWRFLTCSNK